MKMGFNVIDASKKIASQYRNYLRTMFDIRDAEYKAIFDQRLNESKSISKGPFLDVTNSFEKGRSVKQLINDGVLSQDFRKIQNLYNIPNLYKHQEEALLASKSGKNLIVTTGTGSGKTECFLIPIIDELMREKEQGKLTDGVRALIIYPMNALANDQIDRLRKLFIDYPDITFGCYTGQTKHHEKTTARQVGAIDQYEELNGKRIDDVRLRKPLPNERISRDAMKERPPHILITNYAMLEYLLLRPEDSVFFDEKLAQYWKYVVLDEAHTYSGSTGIEVSMLLRRLEAKIKKNDLQFILTSATLGGKDRNKEIISFAERLCSVPFTEEGIIRGKRIELKQIESEHKLDSSFFLYVDSLIDEGYDDSYIIDRIEEKYHFGIKEKSLETYLYDLLMEDDTFWEIKEFLSSPRSIAEICQRTGYDEKSISSFVEVASKACKNDSKLFDSRYHMFLRATEGVFITLTPHKDLFLTRKNSIRLDNQDFKVFEAVSCTQCHSLYLTGYIHDNHLIQKSRGDSDEIKEAFYLGERISDTDEDGSLENSDMVVEKYELCPHCGFIRSSNDVHKQGCGHPDKDFVTVYKVKTTDPINGRVTKCVHCENVNRLGILRGFFSGQEASTSVIGTSLFEQLPSHEKRIIVHSEKDDGDGFDIDVGDSVEEVAKAKQFIAFSDSRQAAAYFASYFSMSYDRLLYGRLIIDQLGKSKISQMELPYFVKGLASAMKQDKIIPFDEYLHCLKTSSLSSFNYEKVAWQAILKELVDNALRNSLCGLGLMKIGFGNGIRFGGNSRYNLSSDDVNNICMVFVMGMLSDCSIYYPIGMNESDKEYFTHNGIECSYLESSGSKYVRAFIPVNDSLSNKRLDYLTRVMQTSKPDVDREEVKKLLAAFWSHFFAPNNPERAQIMYRDKEAHYKVNSENLTLEKGAKWYRCSKCGKLTPFNVHGVCPSYHCDGHLEEVDVDELERDNHYYRMYHDLEIKPLRVVEHTAQLDREEAYSYQTLFKDQKIDVLSCSTTFEMGVDVGDLETVFMRNMPPSASNYAQRAGRAGRSKRAAAFALTFCNKANHDFNFFERPLDMIKGEILPPHFKQDNKKICVRHLYSSAFSFFFKAHPEYFTNAKDFMEVSEDTGTSGYDVFEEFLTNDSPERRALKEYLYHAIPENIQDDFFIGNFGWIKWLFDEPEEDYPSLKIVRELYLNDIEELKKAKERAKDEEKPDQFAIAKRIRNYEEEKIISFLSRSNILPKYGFPVDTVALETNIRTNDKNNDLSGLDLSRDLSMAISEYAPGCQVVANNNLLTSRYIKKNPGLEWRLYDYIQCDYCKSLNVALHKNDDDDHELCECHQCHHELDPKKIKTFLIPEFGFVADEDVKKPSLIKPERTYRTEASFFNYDGMAQEKTYKIGSAKVDVALVGNNGEMAMLNMTDFFVCPKCGYAIEPPAGTNPYVKSIRPKKPHKNSGGYYCKGDHLVRYSLGYRFKTDIIRIRIDQPLLSEKNYDDEAYSILQALVLSACKELDIDNKEIAGCLQYYQTPAGPNYGYLLYDTTPGGGGHVKRLDSEEKIINVLQRAYHLTMDCPNCAPDSSCYSCLRTYQNQKYHDVIKRNYVYEYLAQFLTSLNNKE